MNDFDVTGRPIIFEWPGVDCAQNARIVKDEQRTVVDLVFVFAIHLVFQCTQSLTSACQLCVHLLLNLTLPAQHKEGRKINSSLAASKAYRME